MKAMQLLVLLALAAAVTYAGYRYTGGFGLHKAEPPRYILNDIYSLVMIPAPDGSCEAVVGYREKHVIGTFVAEPVKELVCGEYYFQDRADDRFANAPVALVRIENGEYHWVLQSQLVVRLKD